jgi:hypothetical protein
MSAPAGTPGRASAEVTVPDQESPDAVLTVRPQLFAADRYVVAIEWAGDEDKPYPAEDFAAKAVALAVDDVRAVHQAMTTWLDTRPGGVS